MNNITMSVEFDRLPIESLSLDTEEINCAITLSSLIPDDSRQWQTYLNSLASLGLKQWLEERDDNLTVNWQESTIAKPELANVVPVATNLQVGVLKLCTIAIGSLFEQQVSLPRLVVDLPEYVPHFYVLVEVLEEQECCVVRGFISYQQLVEHLQTAQLNSPQADWTYQIPLNRFELDPNRLLLYLRALEPDTIVLPAIPENRQQQLAALEPELGRLLPQLQAKTTQMWQILNWEQASAVLTSPELLEWIYNLQANNLETANTTSVQTYLLDLLKLVTQPAINLGRWLWDELDEIGESLAWNLLPLVPASEFRTPAEEFRGIQTRLKAQGIEIPPVARCGHHNFLLAGNPLRIYAVAWNSSTENNPNMWSLLLILGATAPYSLPNNLKFRISDRTGILAEQQVNPQHTDSYLFTAIAGTWDEKFIASASIAPGVEVTLPPFAFDIRQAS